MINVLLGPPGTGKTHYLVNKISHILEKTSIEPQQVGYFSFTRRAVEEARIKVTRFVGLHRTQLTYFRTLHALAFYQLGLHFNLVFRGERVQQFADWLHLDLSQPVSDSYTYAETWPDKTNDDHILFMMNKARVTMLADKKLEGLIWRCHWQKAWRIIRAYREYKRAKYYYDYTDMLEQLIMRQAYPNLDLIVIDEAQDLSPLQWQVVHELIEHNPLAEVYIAGDDDQSIYEWAGASVDHFMDVVKYADRRLSLQQSYRVPRAIHKMAQKAIGYCKERIPKDWLPTKEEGRISYRHSLKDIAWNINKTYLCLARNNYILDRIIHFLKERRLPYAKLQDKNSECEPIRVSTIHGAKGAQADTTILDMGMSRAAYNNGWKTDAEARVWYVAVTRASNELILMKSKNNSRSSLYIQPPLS